MQGLRSDIIGCRDRSPSCYRKKSVGEFLLTIATKVVEEFTLISEALVRDEVVVSGDSVYNYLCHYGTLVMEFRDAWAEGMVSVLIAVGNSSSHIF